MSMNTSSSTGEREPVILEGGKLKAPQELYSNPSAARSVFMRLRGDSYDRSEVNAMIDGIIAGNPPYDPEELDASGLGHISNFNDLSAHSTYERSMLAYANAITQTKTLVKFTLHLGEEEDAPKFAGVMSRELDYVLKKWRSFKNRVYTTFSQLVKYGYSFALWPDEESWMFDTISADRVLLPDNASSDIDEWTFFYIVNTYTMQYLYSVYQASENAAKGFPWSRKELEQLIIRYANTLVKNQGNAYESIGHVMDSFASDSALQGGLMSDSIVLVSLFQKEYDEKWSHYMFDPQTDCGDFVYSLPSQYETLSEFFVPFIATPGEFNLYDSKGVGHKIFSSAQAQLQINNSVVDMAKLAASPLIKGASTLDNEHVRITPGVLNYIGAADMAQTQFGTNIGQLVSLSQFLSNKMEYNISNSGDNPIEPDKSVGSLSPAEGVRISHKEFALTKNHISQFYDAFDIVVENMVRRMLKSKSESPGDMYAAAWKEGCVAKGVPQELMDMLTKAGPTATSKLTGLPKILDVATSRVAGSGSQYSSLLAMQQFSELMGGDIGGPAQIADFREQAIINTFGPEYLEVYKTDVDAVDERRGGASLAGTENNDMRSGFSPIFSLDNEHRAHFTVHMALGREIIKRIGEREMDVVEADRVFNVLLPHIQEHAEALAKARFHQKWFESKRQALIELKNYADTNRKNAQRAVSSEIEKRKRDAEETTAVMTDQERKDFVARSDEARKDRQLEAKEQRTAEAQETRGETMKRKVELDAENARLKTVLEADNSRRKTVEELSLAQLKQEGERMRGDSPSPSNIEYK